MLFEEPAALYLDGVGFVRAGVDANCGSDFCGETEGHRHRMMRPTQLHRPMPVRCTN